MAIYYEDIVINGRTIGRKLVNTDPVEPSKRRYTFPQFIRALTDDEFSTVETIATANTAQGKRARRVLAVWKADGVDLNDSLTLTALTAVLGDARVAELS